MGMEMMEMLVRIMAGVLKFLCAEYNVQCTLPREFRNSMMAEARVSQSSAGWLKKSTNRGALKNNVAPIKKLIPALNQNIVLMSSTVRSCLRMSAVANPQSVNCPAMAKNMAVNPRTPNSCGVISLAKNIMKTSPNGCKVSLCKKSHFKPLNVSLETCPMVVDLFDDFFDRFFT